MSADNVPHTDGCRTLAEYGGICGRLPDGTPCCVAEGHAPDPVPFEERVRHEVRAKHADCDPKVCPLARVWADDVREIIEVADRIRRDAGDATTETHVEYRVYIEQPGGLVTRHRFSDQEMLREHLEYLGRTGWTGARVESRTVTTTRHETPWEAQR